MSYRVEKIEHLIKEEISLIFLYKMQDPALSLLTITNVKVSPDLKLVKIYLSVFDKEKRELVLERVKASNSPWTPLLKKINKYIKLCCSAFSPVRKKKA